MKTGISLFVVFMVIGTSVQAQVDAIKKSSSSNSSKGSSDGGRSSSGSGFGAYLFVDFAVRTIVPWQVNTLQKRGEVPNVLSLEVFGSVAIQPSTYYVFNPRVRGNWGIFLTDFRINYMIEEKIGEPSDLRTDDWQILGLNIINNRNVTARFSTGIMHEAFGEGRTFNESVVGLSVMNNNQSIGGMGEFRWSRDFATGSNPRLEASVAIQKKLFDYRAIHMFATGGAMFQRYYNEINVWGFTGGLAFKLY